MLDETKLFDFVRIMFTKPNQYKNVKNFNKKRHHFMINRFFAIKFPANAQLFNINGINGNAVIDSWHTVSSRFKSVPGWVYTKTKKAAPKPKKSKTEYIPKEETIKFFLLRNEIGMREFNDLKKFNPVELNKNLLELENTMQVY
jgi:hypothetical protein